MRSRSEKTKRCVRSVRFQETEIVEIESEMRRQGRPFAWLVRRAWRIARKQISALPSIPAAEGEG